VNTGWIAVSPVKSQCLVHHFLAREAHTRYVLDQRFTQAVLAPNPVPARELRFSAPLLAQEAPYFAASASTSNFLSN
jgi:hypothetical protein